MDKPIRAGSRELPPAVGCPCELPVTAAPSAALTGVSALLSPVLQGVAPAADFLATELTGCLCVVALLLPLLVPLLAVALLVVALVRGLLKGAGGCLFWVVVFPLLLLSPLL